MTNDAEFPASRSDSDDEEIIDGELVDEMAATSAVNAADDATAGGGFQVADADDADVVDQQLRDTGADDPDVVAGELVDEKPVADDEPMAEQDQTAAAAADANPGAAQEAGQPATGEPAAPVRTAGITTSPTAAPAFDYTDAGVPTLGYVRDKIEQRYGTSLGSTELAAGTDAAQAAQRASQERDRLAKEKLAAIRTDLGQSTVGEWTAPADAGTDKAPPASAGTPAGNAADSSELDPAPVRTTDPAPSGETSTQRVPRTIDPPAGT